MENLNKPYNVALIDADSMTYILAYNHREHRDLSTMKEACDDFLKSIMILTQSTHYLGVFSPKENFRHRVYKYALYKGNRPEKSDFQRDWEPIIKEHYTSQWGFITAIDLEADDVVVNLAERLNKEEGRSAVICTPDKDLSQVAGYFYDYKKNVLFDVTKDQALYNLWRQVLTGDVVDNIKGVPGCGVDKAEKLLKDVHPFTWPTKVKEAYIKYFGEHYGPIIFEENHQSIRMMDSYHPLYKEYTTYLYLMSRGIQEYNDKSAQDIRANIFQGL